VKNKLTTRGVAHFGAVQELPFTRGLHQGEQGRRPAVQDRAAVQDRTERGGCGGEAGQGGGWRRRQGGGQGTVSIGDLGCSLVWQVVVVL
jgi:hypothetical protein